MHFPTTPTAVRTNAASPRLVDFKLHHGRIEGDKHVLDRNVSRRLVAEFNEALRLAKQVLDKRGVTVVADDDTLITAYNANTPVRHRNGGPTHA